MHPPLASCRCIRTIGTTTAAAAGSVWLTDRQLAELVDMKAESKCLHDHKAGGYRCPQRGGRLAAKGAILTEAGGA